MTTHSERYLKDACITPAAACIGGVGCDQDAMSSSSHVSRSTRSFCRCSWTKYEHTSVAIPPSTAPGIFSSVFERQRDLLLMDSVARRNQRTRLVTDEAPPIVIISVVLGKSTRPSQPKSRPTEVSVLRKFVEVIPERPRVLD